MTSIFGFFSVLFSSFPFIKHLGCVMMRFLGTIWCVAGVLCRMLAFSWPTTVVELYGAVLLFPRIISWVDKIMRFLIAISLNARLEGCMSRLET